MQCHLYVNQLHLHLDDLLHTVHIEVLTIVWRKINHKTNLQFIFPATVESSPRIICLRMLHSRSRLMLKANHFFSVFCLVRLLTHLCHSRPCTPRSARCIMLPGASGLRYQFWRSPLTVNHRLLWGTCLYEGLILVCSAWQYQNQTSHTSAKRALASNPEAKLRFGVVWSLFLVIFSICSVS